MTNLFSETPIEEIDHEQARGNGAGHEFGGAPGNELQFKLKRFHEIVLSTAPNYLIKGLLPRRGLAVIWGLPKCGKSFVAFDMGMHIALGRAYRDRRVQAGTVVYLAPEGGGGFPARVEAWRQRFLTVDETANDIPFRLVNDVRIDLIADHPRLIAAIRAQVEPEPPVAIFVDTLNRSLVGDENAPADMGKYVRAADVLSTAFDCLVVLIHHCGIAGTRPRGHSSLSGADDVEISVAKDASGLITVAVDLMKDGPVGAPFGCRLEGIAVGTDDDGDPITSCVVIPTAAGKTAGIQLTANQARFVDILREAIVDCPATPLELQGTATVPSGVTAVTRDVLKKYCVAKGWLEEIESGKSRAKVSDMLNTLAGKKLIGLTNRFVWWISTVGTAGTAGTAPQAHPAEKGSPRAASSAGSQAPQGVSLDTLRACGDLRDAHPGLAVAAFEALVNTYSAMVFEAADGAALERLAGSFRKRLTDRGLTPDQVETALASIISRVRPG